MPFVSIEFPFPQTKTPLGLFLTPVIPIGVFTLRGLVTFDFLLDSGADFTLLPRHVADLVGVDLKQLSPTRTFGVEGKGIRVWLSRVTIRIGPETLSVRSFFSERDDTPFLLGRMDVFSKFKIELDPKRKKIRFTKA